MMRGGNLARWSFNWIPNLEALISGTAGSFDNMQLLKAEGGAPEGFTCAFGLSGKGEEAIVSCRSRYSRVKIGDEEVERTLDVFGKCLGWVLEEKNSEGKLERWRECLGR
jgi:hypothetical protein